MSVEQIRRDPQIAEKAQFQPIASNQNIDEPCSTSRSFEREDSPNLGGRMRRRGRKPAKVDVKGRLEKSRQSARECRARKKLRYQYIEELVADRERAIFSLRDELETYRKLCHKMDQGTIPTEVKKIVENMEDAKKSSE